MKYIATGDYYGTLQRANHSHRHRRPTGQVKSSADSKNPISKTQAIRVSKPGHGKVIAADFDHSQIGNGLSPHYLSREASPVGKSHPQVGSTFHHVIIGEDVALPVED